MFFRTFFAFRSVANTSNTLGTQLITLLTNLGYRCISIWSIVNATSFVKTPCCTAGACSKVIFSLGTWGSTILSFYTNQYRGFRGTLLQTSTLIKHLRYYAGNSRRGAYSASCTVTVAVNTDASLLYSYISRARVKTRTLVQNFCVWTGCSVIKGTLSFTAIAVTLITDGIIKSHITRWSFCVTLVLQQ